LSRDAGKPRSHLCDCRCRSSSPADRSPAGRGARRSGAANKSTRAHPSDDSDASSVDTRSQTRNAASGRMACDQTFLRSGLPPLIDGDGQRVVDRIVDHRDRRSAGHATQHSCAHWLVFSDSADTWEPQEALEHDVADVVRDYEIALDETTRGSAASRASEIRRVGIAQSCLEECRRVESSRLCLPSRDALVGSFAAGCTTHTTLRRRQDTCSCRPNTPGGWNHAGVQARVSVLAPSDVGSHVFVVPATNELVPRRAQSIRVGVHLLPVARTVSSEQAHHPVRRWRVHRRRCVTTVLDRIQGYRDRGIQGYR